MNNAHDDPAQPSTDATLPESPPAFAADMQAETANAAATRAWDERIMRNMKRMAVDEAYRLEIAKNLS